MVREDGGTETDIEDATDSAYTIVAADEGKAIKVVVSFTDDRGNEETLTSAPTVEVEVVMPPLTASYSVPEPHDGQTAFTFMLWFSEEFPLSYLTLRDHAFTVAGGTVTRARRAHKGSNMLWEIHVQPNSDAAVTIVLPATVDCDAEEAICTEDSRPLSNRIELTVAGPEEPAPNSAATGAPTITGTAQVGGTLTADTSGIDDDDRLDHVAFSYQWLADDAEIAGATGETYTLIEADEGKTIKVTVSFTDAEGNPETLTSDPTGEVDSEAGPLTAFTVVDTSTDPDKVLGTLEDGRTLTLAAPAGDSYGIRVDTESNDDIQKVELALSRAKTEGKTEWEPPYSLYGDSGEENLTGEDLPAGSYDLTATAYKNNGDVMGTLKVSFSVAYADPAEEQPPAQNTLATGAPTIDGIARVGETLTADTSGIADEDGLENVSFSYEWLADDTAIQGATNSTYTLADADEGKTIKVRVSFTDDAGNEETLISGEVGPVVSPQRIVVSPNCGQTVDFAVEAYDHEYVSLLLRKPNNLDITNFVLQRYEHDGAEFVSSGDVRRIEGELSSSLPSCSDLWWVDFIVEPNTLYKYTYELKDDSGSIVIETSLTVRTPPIPDSTGVADATLSDLTLSGIDFVPTLAAFYFVGPFLSDTVSYVGEAANSVTQTRVSPTLGHAGAGYVIMVDGVPDVDGVVPLSLGSSMVTVEVTAEDDTTTRTYTITAHHHPYREYPGHRRAHHRRHRTGGRDADGGHLRHRRRGRADQRHVQLPVDQF